MVIVNFLFADGTILMIAIFLIRMLAIGGFAGLFNLNRPCLKAQHLEKNDKFWSIFSSMEAKNTFTG